MTLGSPHNTMHSPSYLAIRKCAWKCQKFVGIVKFRTSYVYDITKSLMSMHHIAILHIKCYPTFKCGVMTTLACTQLVWFI